MNSMKYVLLGLALGSAVSMADDCTPPAAPQISEGEDSSLEQMLATQKSVKEFQAANLAYMSCLEPQVTAAEAEAKAAIEAKSGEAEAAQKLQQLQETYNAAVSREEEIAGKFNTEIRDYKTAHPG